MKSQWSLDGCFTFFYRIRGFTVISDVFQAWLCLTCEEAHILPSQQRDLSIIFVRTARVLVFAIFSSSSMFHQDSTPVIVSCNCPCPIKKLQSLQNSGVQLIHQDHAKSSFRILHWLPIYSLLTCIKKKLSHLYLCLYVRHSVAQE